MKKLKCDDCGTTENVRRDIDPFALDCYDEVISIVICDDCWIKRAQEITYDPDYDDVDDNETIH